MYIILSPALRASSSSHGPSIFQTALQTTWTFTWNTVNKQPPLCFSNNHKDKPCLLQTFNIQKLLHQNVESFYWWIWYISLCGMTPLTFALQECGHELIEGSRILKESSHLVEVVWRHHDILRVPHDIDNLRQVQIFMNRKSCSIVTETTQRRALWDIDVTKRK